MLWLDRAVGVRGVGSAGAVLARRENAAGDGLGAFLVLRVDTVAVVPVRTLPAVAAGDAAVYLPANVRGPEAYTLSAVVDDQIDVPAVLAAADFQAAPGASSEASCAGLVVVRFGSETRNSRSQIQRLSVQLTLDIYTDASIIAWGGAIDKLPPLKGCDKTVTSPSAKAQGAEKSGVARGVA